VLRYWEEEISFLEPEKNIGGRRMYGDKELNLLYRLKYLIVEKRLTVEGAKLALLDEMSGPHGNEKAQIHAQRKNLLDSLDALGRLKEETAEFAGSSFIPPGQEHLREIWQNLSPGKRRNLSADLMHLPQELLTLLAALRKRSPDAVTAVSTGAALEVTPRKSRLAAQPLTGAAAECLASGRLALVTVLPDTGAGAQAAAGALRQLAQAVREGVKPYGPPPVWYIFTSPERCAYVENEQEPPSLRTLLCRGDSFFYDEEKVIFTRQPFFPYLDEEDRLRIQEDGRVAGYASGMAGVLLVMSSPAFQRGLAARGIDTLCILPLNHFSLNFPGRELLEGHIERRADLSVLCALSGDGGYATTGNYILRPGFLSLPLLIADGNSADELEELPLRKIRSSLSLYIGGAGRIWGIREEE
jgi:DNA-binding transcriptional MerR regulator